VSDNSRYSGFDIVFANAPRYESGWDMLADPANAAYLAKALPKAKPVPYPPPKPFKMPSLWNVVFTPFVREFLEKETIGEAKEKINNLKNDLNYMNLINYEGLANEATNRHISNQKR